MFFVERVTPVAVRLRQTLRGRRDKPALSQAKKKSPHKVMIFSWSGLRDDYRTMDWVQVVANYGYSAKMLDKFLVKV